MSRSLVSAHRCLIVAALAALLPGCGAPLLGQVPPPARPGHTPTPAESKLPPPLPDTTGSPFDLDPGPPQATGEPAKAQQDHPEPFPDKKPEEAAKVDPRVIEEMEKALVKAETELAALLPRDDDLKPFPPFVIPDNPPPHEGAMINAPLTVQPPDILVIEVLEALPGRPITGERLVRPDGTISLDFYGEVQVRGLTLRQVKEKVVLHLRRHFNDEILGLIEYDDSDQPYAVPAADTSRVFVDVSSYNHSFYYVSGDLNAPARFSWTGHETIADAIQFSAGLAPTSDRSDIWLYRPGADPGEAKTYKIDLDAIDHGVAAANLQLFPGDRLVVGRDPSVRTTLELDRIHASSATRVQQIVNISRSVKYVVEGMGELPSSKSQRAALVDEWVDATWLEVDDDHVEGTIDKSAYRRLLRHAVGLTDDDGT